MACGHICVLRLGPSAYSFGGKIATGHCGYFLMNSVRHERNSFSGSSAEATESGTNSTSTHCPWEMRITPLFGSVRFLPSSDMGEAETQAQSPLLRIPTSVKTTLACHACESSCIGFVARNLSRIARRKGVPCPGVSTGLASAINTAIKAIPAVNAAWVFIRGNYHVPAASARFGL